MQAHSFAAGKAAAVVAPRAVSRAHCVRPYSLFGNLFGTKAAKADMGSAASKAGAEGSREGWAPSTGAAPRKLSQSGFDVTPLTAEQRQQEAAKLNDFQRCGLAAVAADAHDT
eukprot:GHRQ01037741.1.p2 GENE.GHRQ01037741.1~~GHRQ01037741.1.p2  ORF type:complete len:113 (+),score=29.50 GHRQ01037741.1:180-518(+)